MKNICIVAGEASGDAQAALLIEPLREQLAKVGVQNPEFWGAAGPKMRASGVLPFVESEELAVMAFTEIVPRYFHIQELYSSLLNEIERRKPLAVILVDYPGFNLKLAKDLYLRGHTVLYHIAPKVWAHGWKRCQILAQYTHALTCILPFEQELLRQAGVPATFVGNPLADAVAQYHDTGIKSGSVLGLIPGSRKSEVSRMLPLFLDAAALVAQKRGPLEVQIPVAATLQKEWIAGIVAQKSNPDLKIKLCEKGIHPVLAAADYAFVCSGTATLEAALMGTPHSVAYRMQFVSAVLAKLLIKSRYVSLVNLCANKMLVPEFLQYAATPQALATHALRLLENPDKAAEMKLQLKALANQFPLGAAQRTAREMALTMLQYCVPAHAKFRVHELARTALIETLK